MSNFPVTKMVKDKEVIFNKISNEKLVKVYEKFIFALSKIKMPDINRDDYKSDEEFEAVVSGSSIMALLETLGDDKMDKFRDLFFSNMIIPGFGVVSEKLESILEDDLSIHLELFVTAFEVYLGKYLTKALDKQNSK